MEKPHSSFEDRPVKTRELENLQLKVQEEINALRKNEERYKAAFLKSAGMLFLIDKENGTVLDASEAACRHYGYTRDEMLRLGSAGLSAEPEEADALTGDIQNPARQRMQRRKDGSVFPAEILSTALQLESRSVSLVEIRDSGERIKSEQSVREIEEKYKAFFDNELTAICIFDAETKRFLDVNRAYTVLYGYSRQELLDWMTIHDITVEHEAADIAAARAMLDGTVFVPLRWHRKKDGTVFPVELVAGPCSIKERRAVFGLALDITARVQAENELRERQNLLQTILDNVNSVIVIKDARGNYLMVNRKTESLVGLKNAEITGKSPLDIYPSPIGERIHSDDMQVIKSGQPIVIEEKLRADDDRIYLTTKVPLFDDNGKPLGLCGLATDITERIQLQREHANAAKIESLGVLAGGLAHDFNNILTTVLGNISLAEITMKDDPGKAKEMLEESGKACLRAKDITRQLLAFSKGGEPLKKTFCVKETVKKAVMFALSGSNIKPEFVFTDEPCMVDADEGQINQVVNNLVINALQAMPQGGELKVEIRKIETSGNIALPLPAGQYVVISFHDRGGGIPGEILTRIFDPYFTTKQKGSGLGLTACFTIVKKHGGHITAESEPGAGSAFHVYLPLSGHSAPEQAEPGKDFHAEGGRVLLMDDETGVLKIGARMLEHLGYRVETALCGAEAVKLYKSAMKNGKGFDAVILDLTIPGGMGGKVALKKLLEADPEVKALVSSGYSSDAILSNYEQHGFSGVISKPYTVAELKAALHGLKK